jgi:hypothetical protein
LNDQRPREARTKVLIRARLRGVGAECDACIVDASTRGLLVTCSTPPARGAFVELVASGYPLIGHVKWSNGRRFGVVLQDRISVAALVANDGGPVRLPKSATGRRSPGQVAAAVSADAPGMARVFNFALAIVAALAAGVFLMSTLQSAMGSFGKVSAVMEHQH